MVGFTTGHRLQSRCWPPTELAALLRVSRSTVYKLTRTRADLDAWVVANRITPRRSSGD